MNHTCANDDGKRDVGMAVDPCLACDVEIVRECLAAEGDSLERIDRIAAALSTRAEWVALVAESQANSEKYIERAHAAEAMLAALAKIEAWCNNDERRIELFRWMHESGVWWWRCDTRDNEDNLDLTAEFAGPDLAAMLVDVGEWCTGHMGSVFDRRSEP